jgi:hypothetical protein
MDILGVKILDEGKFAELIIQDCISIIKKLQIEPDRKGNLDQWDDGWNNGCNQVIDDLMIAYEIEE